MARPSNKETTRRLLAMIRFLNTQHTKVPLQKLASLFNISIDQARKDVEILSLCGIGDTERFDLITAGDEAVVLNKLPVLQKPLRLSHSESIALEDALNLAGIEQDSALRKKVLDAKGSSELNKDTVQAMVSQSQIGINTNFLEQISTALSSHRLVNIYYQSLKDSQTTNKAIPPSPRLIEPYQLINYNSMWYLEAFSIDAHAMRVYRLDRIAALHVLDQSFEARGIPLSSSPIKLQDAPFALLAVYDDTCLEQDTLPGIEKIEASKTLNDEYKRKPIYYARIPYVSDTWLPKQVLASLGALEILTPQTLRERCKKLAKEMLTQSF